MATDEGAPRKRRLRQKGGGSEAQQKWRNEKTGLGTRITFVGRKCRFLIFSAEPHKEAAEG